MNEYLREAVYAPLRDAEAQKRLGEVAMALSNNPAFIDADWAKYQDDPALPLWKLAALSAGINPDCAWSEPANAKQVAEFVSGEAGERLRAMLERLAIAERNLDRHGGKVLLTIEADQSDAKCTVRIDDFMSFAKSKRWAFPDATTEEDKKRVENGVEDCKENRSGDAELKSEALRLAQEIGLRKYRYGERNISGRNVSEQVARELAKNPKWHGIRGPREAGSIRSTVLKGWKFIYPESGTSGMSGTNE